MIDAVLVTGNAHKVAELAAILAGWHLEALRLAVEPVEDGTTYTENARIKARAGLASAPDGAWVLGEDSGIEAVALDGGPGIASARWDNDGVGRLLRELEGVVDRRARYVCEIVALDPSGREHTVRGELEGQIAMASRGSEGFGYDPIFIPAGETATVAELGNVWKLRHSHRARAAAALAHAIS